MSDTPERKPRGRNIPREEWAKAHPWMRLSELPPQGAGDDPVNHPSHYTQGGIECIDAIEAACSGLVGMDAVLTAQVIKYLWRWKWKNGVQDIEKAEWYLKRLKKRLTPPTEQPDGTTSDGVPPSIACRDCGETIHNAAVWHDEASDTYQCARCAERSGE